MECAAWTSGRQRAALARVRAAGLCLAAVLLCAAAWLGWREARLARLPGETRQAVLAEEAATARLRLKYISEAVYLAKVRRNSLLADITGTLDVESSCTHAGDLRGLPDSSPCAAKWRDALRRTWAAAFEGDGPPLPEELARDPWGSPYILNQSEASCGHYGNWCPHDVVRSAGPDGRPNTPDDIAETIPQHLGPSRLKTAPASGG